MKKRLSVNFVCILMLALTFLAGCGGSYESASETVAMEAPASEAYYAEDIYTGEMVTEEARSVPSAGLVVSVTAMPATSSAVLPVT